MKKVFVLALALVVAGLAFAGGGQQAGGGAAKPVVVQIGYENNPGEPVDLAAHEWKRVLEELSGGTMSVELFPSNQLGSKDQIMDQMLAGMNVITLADGGFFADRGAPDMGIVVAPYFFASWDEVWKLQTSDWWKGQEKILAGKGLQVLAANWMYGDRHTLNKRPIRTVADWAGQKIRSPNNTAQIKGLEIMGAQPTPLPLGEVYTALQQGVVDGVENPLTVLYGQKFYETAKYLTLDGHIRMFTAWFCGTQWYNTLTPQQQQWVAEAGVAAGRFNNNLVENAAQEYIDAFKKEGVEIIEIDVAAFQAKARPYYDLPEFTSVWSKGLYETASKAKALQ
ncbi:C4-dicarboxylate ABC transporter [Spirochaetia bacterium]|nr:C4-dicarboxylate ABC transporter [Spirochaetia bacterium]